MFAPKTLKPLYFYLRLAKNPDELDRVFQMRESVVSPAVMKIMESKLKEDPQGRRAIETNRRLGHFTMRELRALPEGSLGRAYAEFMTENDLSPDAIPRLPETAPFAEGHLLETHDLWHVITGFGPDVAGEAGLQAVYAAQLPGMLPAALASALLLNAALERSSVGMKRRFDAIARGWLMGQRAKRFFGYDFQANFPRPLSEVRAELGIDMALSVPGPMGSILTPDEERVLLAA
ncbi:MAG: Coq4 family protein [Polyangiaceae bacterium]